VEKPYSQELVSASAPTCLYLDGPRRRGRGNTPLSSTVETVIGHGVMGPVIPPGKGGEKEEER